MLTSGPQNSPRQEQPCHKESCAPLGLMVRTTWKSSSLANSIDLVSWGAQSEWCVIKAAGGNQPRAPAGFLSRNYSLARVQERQSPQMSAHVLLAQVGENVRIAEYGPAANRAGRTESSGLRSGARGSRSSRQSEPALGPIGPRRSLDWPDRDPHASFVYRSTARSDVVTTCSATLTNYHGLDFTSLQLGSKTDLPLTAP